MCAPQQPPAFARLMSARVVFLQVLPEVAASRPTQQEDQVDAKEASLSSSTAFQGYTDEDGSAVLPGTAG